MGMFQDPFGHTWGIVASISKQRTTEAARKWTEQQQKAEKKRTAEPDSKGKSKKAK